MNVSKKSLLLTLCMVTGIVFANATFTALAAENQVTGVELHAANLIRLNTTPSKEKELSEFLQKGANIVQSTEPQTTLWYALKENEHSYGIFDAFPNEEERSKHFAGKVAAALKEQSPKLIVGGWDAVLKSISNYKILSYSLNKNASTAKEATVILLTAAPGKESSFEAFLTKAAKMVQDTEPKTLFWAALKLDDTHFAIFDTFEDDSGRQAHFSGKVAHELKENASELLQGGLENVKHMKIIATAHQF